MTTSTMNVLATNTDASGQDLLRDRGMLFRRAVVAIEDIDRDRSLHNQARFSPLNEETVGIYRAAMENGDAFPPIIVDGPDVPYVVLDGNHRLVAAEMAGFTHLTALIVTEASPAAKELLTYEANTKHGLPTTLEERIKQGLYLVAIGNVPAVVARALAIPERKFWAAVADARVHARLVRLGFDPKRFLSSVRDRLDNVASDPVFEAAARLLQSGALETAEVSEFIRKVNAQPSEAEQLALIEQMAKERAGVTRSTAGGRLPLPRNINRLRMGARVIVNIDVDQIGAQMDKLDPELRSLITSEAMRAIAKLTDVVNVIRKHG